MSEEKKLTDEIKIDERLEDLLVEFDEMGFTPTTTCPYPEEYAQRWKKALINKIHRLQSKKAELQKQVDEQKERIRDLITDCDNCPLPRQAVKDTAKEILTELYETKFKMFSDDLIYADNIKVFAKKYGVEVE